MPGMRRSRQAQTLQPSEGHRRVLRTLYPAIKRANPACMLRVSVHARDLLRGVRQPQEGKPAVFVHGELRAQVVAIAHAAARLPAPIASSCSISAAAAGASRTPASRTTPPGTWSRTWKAAQAPRHRAMAGVRRSYYSGANARLTLAAARTQRQLQRVGETRLCAASSRCLDFELRWFYYEGGAGSLFRDHWRVYFSARFRPPSAAT